MGWQIFYYSDKVQQEILALPVGLKARYIRLTDLMLAHGPDLGMPHTRAMGRGLYELRLKGEEGIARVMYCVAVGQKVFILSCFKKKSQKTPKTELKTAYERLKQVMSNAKP